MDRKYTINAVNGRVKYITMQESGPVGSETSLDNVLWILKQGKPYPAMSMPGTSAAPRGVPVFEREPLRV